MELWSLKVNIDLMRNMVYGNSINMDEFVSEAADFICSNVESISKNNFEPSGFTDKYSFAALSEATLDIYKGIV